MTIDPTKEKLFYNRPGDSVRCVVEVERDESGKFKKIRCPLSPSRYVEFLIDEITLLGECGEPFCRKTIQFFREPVRPDIPPETKKTPHKAKVNHQDGEGLKASKTWRKNNPESPAVEAEQEPKEEIAKSHEDYSVEDFDSRLPQLEGVQGKELPDKVSENHIETELRASPQAEDVSLNTSDENAQEIFEGDPFEDETWISLYRKFIKNPIFKDSAAVHLWIYLLLKANNKKKRFLFNKKEITIQRGQLITGLHRISEDTGISEWRVRERLRAFEGLGMTTSKTTNKFRIINVRNYNEYQNPISKKPQAKPQTVDSTKLYPNPQSTHNQPTTNNKVNKINKEHYVEGSEPLRLAALLLNEILKNKPNLKKPNLQAWAKEIDLMIWRDGRKPERIREAILWCQRHYFWWKNVLSTGKLRKQFDRLEIEMEDKKKDPSKTEMRVQYQDLTGRGTA